MFHFKRRTLWIIIYITIPMVIVLNNLTSEPETDNVSEESMAQRWSLDALSMDCSPRLCQLALPSANHLWLSIRLPQLPASQVDIPDLLQLRLNQQGGFVIATVKIQPDKSSLTAMEDFLLDWVPANDQLQWLLVGDIPTDLPEWLLDNRRRFAGEGIPNALQPPTGLAVIASPALGTQQQLDFLLWIEILKRRLAGYDVQVTWDHRSSVSYVVFNQTLAKTSFVPLKADELPPVLNAYLASTEQRQRTGDQLHRYALTAMIYEIPFEFFVNQKQRLGQVTVPDVDKMREFTLEQITQNSH